MLIFTYPSQSSNANDAEIEAVNFVILNQMQNSFEYSSFEYSKICLCSNSKQFLNQARIDWISRESQGGCGEYSTNATKARMDVDFVHIRSRSR